MNPTHFAYFLALGATLCFSSASLIFAQYTRRFGTLWMNAVKAGVAFFFCVLTMGLYGPFTWPTTETWLPLMTSGLIGLCIGDLFLLIAFTHLGVARTMMLFGFQPLIIGVLSTLILGQTFEARKLLAVIFLVACLVTFAYEGFQKEKNWKMKGLLFAMIGVLFDAAGVMLSRYGYDHSPTFPALHGHLVRCFGALCGFFVLQFVFPLKLKTNFMQLNRKEVMTVLGASFLGTFFSLFLYLNALRIGHLGSLTGIAVTGPMFAGILECILKKKGPSFFLILSFLFFFAGFTILIT